MAPPAIKRVRTGCWTCRRRGYRCDEAKPSCEACSRLRIECEGYGVRLNWEANTRKLTRRKGDADGRLKAAKVARAAKTPSDTGDDEVATPMKEEKDDESPTQVIVRQTANVPDLRTMGSSPPRSSREWFLLQHFFYTLTGLLSSSDDKSINTFSCVIMPMAFKSNILFDTILSLSALHLSSRFPQFEQDASRLKGRALSSLVTRMQHWSGFESSTLATIIMLSIHEIFAASPQGWAAHLTGAGSLLHDFIRLKGKDGIDRSTRTLLDIFAYHNVLASISIKQAPAFPEHYISSLGWSSMPGQRTAFLASVDTLLSLVAQISTLLSVARCEGFRDFQGSRYLFDVVALQQKLHFWKPPDAIPDHTRNTADAMKQAALLFCFESMGNQIEYKKDVERSAMMLIQSISKVPISSPTVASHVWPLYMAGSVVTEMNDRNFVRERLKEMYRVRGVNSILSVQDRLENIWDGSYTADDAAPVVLY